MTQEKIPGSLVKGLSRKNLLINGGMDIWQRGDTFSTAVYTADRWRFSLGGGTGTVSKLSVGVSKASQLRIQMTVAGSFEAIFQRLEDPRISLIQGKTVTMSFKLDSDIATTGRVQIQNFYGSGGSSTDIISKDFAIASTTGQSISVTMEIPSSVGKTLGTGAFTEVIIYPSKDSAVTYIMDISEVQLELGNTATVFEKRLFGEEMALCQRYYEKSYNDDRFEGDTQGGAGAQNAVSVGTSGSANTAAVTMTVAFAVRKRAGPTVKVFQPNTGVVAQMRNVASGVSVAADSVSANETLVVIKNTATVVASQRHHCHWTADAEL